MNSALVFLAEELGGYIRIILGCPSLDSVALPNNPNRVDKFIAAHRHLKLPEDHLFLGVLLVLHWRNRIIHKRSSSSLTKAQESAFIECSPVLREKYKNLDATTLLENFSKNLPSLKDTSSLISLTINCVRRIEDSIPAPESREEVRAWLSHLGLITDLDRVIRSTVNSPHPERAVTNFLNTNCPELREAYLIHCTP